MVEKNTINTVFIQGNPCKILKNTIKPLFEEQSNNNVVNLQAYLNENQLQSYLNNKIQQKNTYFVISAQLFKVKRNEADKKRR